MTTNEKFKQVFSDVKIFSCGTSTKTGAANAAGSKSNTSYGESEAKGFTDLTAFPVLKLVTGGVSSRFFGVIPTNKQDKMDKDILS